MQRALAVTVIVLAASLAGCATGLEARFPQAGEVEHVVVNTGSYEAERGDNHTVTLIRSRALDPGNATFERIVEHALPLIEDVDEASLQQAPIEWDSNTPGNGQPYVDLLFQKQTPLRWSTRKPIEPAFVESMRVILEPANGTQPIVAVENENGWHWWRTDGDVDAIREAASPVMDRAKEEGRAREPVSIRGPGDTPPCRTEPYSEGEIGLASLHVEGLGNQTLTPWNVSHVLEPEAYELDETNRTIRADWNSTDPVYLVLQLTTDAEPARLVLGSCQWLKLGWTDHRYSEILLKRGRDSLAIEHVDDACPKDYTGPQPNQSDYQSPVLTRIATGEEATVHYLDEGGDACANAGFTYQYQVGWRLVEGPP